VEAGTTSGSEDRQNSGAGGGRLVRAQLGQTPNADGFGPAGDSWDQPFGYDHLPRLAEFWIGPVKAGLSPADSG
jgi:hypothetical protein